MLDEDQRPLLRHLAEEREHHPRLVVPEPGERLVDQQQLRVGGQHHGDLELPLLAVAQLGGS